MDYIFLLPGYILKASLSGIDLVPLLRRRLLVDGMSERESVNANAMSECICVLISFVAFLISIFSRRYAQTHAIVSHSMLLHKRMHCSYIRSYVDFVAIDIAQQIEDSKTTHIDIALVRQRAKLLFNVSVVMVVAIVDFIRCKSIRIFYCSARSTACVILYIFSVSFCPDKFRCCFRSIENTRARWSHLHFDSHILTHA